MINSEVNLDGGSEGAPASGLESASPSEEEVSSSSVSESPEEEAASSEVSEAEASVDSESLEDDDERVRRYIDPELKWFIVNTYSGSEDSVKLSLLERIKKFSLESEFGEIFVPKTVVEKILKSGVKKTVNKTSFPGYIMIQMKMNERTMGCVSAIAKVTGFVGNRKNPRPMSDDDVLRLMHPEANKTQTVSTVAAFDKGEAIKVIDGPFSSFSGVVEEVRPEKRKVKVLVSIFGRETPVELTYEQVEKVK